MMPTTRSRAAGAALALTIALAAGLPAPASSSDAPWLNGWAKSISGETIGYHSPYPDATSALLVRATDGTMAVEWETVPVPADFAGPEATFVLLAGLATQKGAHRFTLSADGEELLAFRTSDDASRRDWDVGGKDGVSLAFKTTLVDQFQELFGFMFLKLPKSRLHPGRPVRLRIGSESGASRDWVMVFQYDLKSGFNAYEEQALVRRRASLMQSVRVEISHVAPPAEAAVSLDGGPPTVLRLETGYNAVYLPVEAVTAEKDIEIRLEIGGRPAGRRTVRLAPVVKREIYLLPHSHVDIGYSDLQVVIEKNHWKYIEQAIELARRTADYPPGARFKWNTEVLWPAETYLRQASPEKRAAFLEAVRKGWIGLQALLANELTGLCSPEELFRLTEFSRALGREAGVPVPSAMITDIPSYSWSVVPALARSGVRYLSSGPNYMPNLTDGGDRIGGALKAWGDKPFYWISPSGEDRILFWMAGRGYSWFHGLNMGSLSLQNRQPIFDYMKTLADAGYPYAMVQVRYTTGGDNGPPDPNLSDFVKAWNEEYESPRFVIATSQEMFEEFERRYGGALPSVKGDFTPYWEDGAASTARETGMNRASAARLVQAETLWSMIDPAPFPAAAFTEAWRQALLWDEHTWGAADSISDPDGANAVTQWAYKQAFALEADKRSRELFEAALGARPASAGGASSGAAASAVDIFNTNSWDMTDVVLLSRTLSAAGDRVTDDAGRPVPSQRLTSGELAVLAARVPAFGAKRCSIAPGRPEAVPAGSEVRAAGEALASAELSLRLDPASGAVASLKSLAGSAAAIEFVDSSSPGLNAYLYVPGKDPKGARGVSSARISVLDAGPLVASLLVESNAPGANGLRREVRICAGSDRVDFLDTLDKSKVRDKESVHIAFPFKIADGAVRLDLGWGTIRPDADQIAGSCRDFFCVQNSADISGPRGGVTWVSLDAPLVEVGAMTDESPGDKNLRAWRASVGPSQTLYSYALNNYWHTNYKADQAGPIPLRYSIRLHGAYDPDEAAKFGLERSRPLVAAAAGPSAAAGPGTRAAKPLFGLATDGLIATSLRPSLDGRGWILRLYNPSDRAREGRLAAGGAVSRSDAEESRGEPVTGPIRLAPFEIATLRIDR